MKDEDLTEDLTLKMSRYDDLVSGRYVERLARSHFVEPGHRQLSYDWKANSAFIKEHFGWTLDEKLRQIQPEKRYWPLIKEIMNSKEFKDSIKFYEKIMDDHFMRRIEYEVNWLRNDVVGGRDWFSGRRYYPTIHTREIREEP